MHNLIYCGKRDNVTKEILLARLEEFATLATQVDFLDVAGFSLWCHPCHACHANKNDEPTFYSEKNDLLTNHSTNQLCFQWLAIAIQEGNLECSQPLIGKAIGWPQRLVKANSLWVDFICWCIKQNILKDEVPERWMFYELLNCIFIQKGDCYELPPLEHCRRTFEILRQQYECN